MPRPDEEHPLGEPSDEYLAVLREAVSELDEGYIYYGFDYPHACADPEKIIGAVLEVAQSYPLARTPAEDVLSRAWGVFADDVYRDSIDFAMDLEDCFLHKVMFRCRCAGSAVLGEFESRDEAGLLFEDLYNVCGYNGVEPDVDDLIERSSFRVNVFLESKEDLSAPVLWRDYGPLDLPDARALRALGPEPDEGSALASLIRSQGLELGYVRSLIDGQRRMWSDRENAYVPLDRRCEANREPAAGSASGNAFADSLLEEIRGIGNLDSTPRVAVLAEVDSDTLARLALAACAGEGCPFRVARGATAGLYDPVCGAGGPLGIELVRDFEFPAALVAGIQVEPSLRHGHRGAQEGLGGYMLDDAYGLVPDCWARGAVSPSPKAQAPPRSPAAEAAAALGAASGTAAIGNSDQAMEMRRSGR